MNVGLVAWGGEHQRGWVHVSLTGVGCEWVPDWDSVPDALETLAGLDYRRCDIALDTKDRSVTHETVLDAYRAGGFNTSGRPPKCQLILSEDPSDGRTIYVGSRENDKFFRAYEKGKQLRSTFKIPGDLVSIDGCPVDDLYRIELELKAKTGPLPSDLIKRRDQYLAGAYPYLQHVMCDVLPEVMLIDRKTNPTLELASALENIRRQYGSTIFTGLVAMHGDIGALMSKITGEHHNEALLRAGVLLVDHD
jgi:phage replication initiation protein